ncbi:hypothetical protein JW758_03120 [Candidatus Peregrinibacteria bacterium]|nr:hypothetical protein [Candidatus Peregrinibacteria bacterium]
MTKKVSKKEQARRERQREDAKQRGRANPNRISEASCSAPWGRTSQAPIPPRRMLPANKLEKSASTE